MISILKWKNRRRNYIRETVYFYSENTVFSARGKGEGLSCKFTGWGKGLRNYQLNETRIADIFKIPKRDMRGYFGGDHPKRVTLCVARPSLKSPLTPL